MCVGVCAGRACVLGEEGSLTPVYSSPRLLLLFRLVPAPSDVAPVSNPSGLQREVAALTKAADKGSGLEQELATLRKALERKEAEASKTMSTLEATTEELRALQLQAGQTKRKLAKENKSTDNELQQLTKRCEVRGRGRGRGRREDGEAVFSTASPPSRGFTVLGSRISVPRHLLASPPPRTVSRIAVPRPGDMTAAAPGVPPHLVLPAAGTVPREEAGGLASHSRRACQDAVDAARAGVAGAERGRGGGQGRGDGGEAAQATARGA